MTEAKALILLFIGMGVADAVLTTALLLTNASGAVLGLVITVLVVLCAFLSSLVVTHYSALKERRKREEILLR